MTLQVRDVEYKQPHDTKNTTKVKQTALLSSQNDFKTRKDNKNYSKTCLKRPVKKTSILVFKESKGAKIKTN